METDFELLERWAQGDTTAGSALIDRHFDAVYRFFQSKTSGDIDDLVQATFEACVTGRDRFRSASSFRGYLLGTARNKLLDHYRRKRNVVDVDEIAQSRLIDLEPSPSAVIARRQEERILLEALRRLPLDYQLVIELYAWEKLTGPEVAQVLGITEAAMRSRLHRAKQELHRVIESISESPEILRSTLANLEHWAEAIRARREPLGGDRRRAE